MKFMQPAGQSGKPVGRAHCTNMQPCNARVANPPLKKLNNRVEEAKFSHTFGSNSNSANVNTHQIPPL